MALGGGYTTIDTVLAKLRRDTGGIVDEADASEWIAEVLATIAPTKMLSIIATDGNPELNHPEPIPVVNYRAKLPCNLVQFKSAFELHAYQKLRPTFSDTHIVNMSKTPNAGTASVYKPDYWESEYTSDPTMQLKDGYIFTNFETGDLIVTYLGWPMDADDNLLIPSDTKVIQALVSTIQYKIDYQLWRAGDIADKVFNDSEQNMHFDVASAGTHAIMPSEDQMYVISNFIKRTVRADSYFQTHFTSLGRKDGFRTHG